MRRLLTVVLLTGSIVISGYAQRGGSVGHGGGFSGSHGFGSAPHISTGFSGARSAPNWTSAPRNLNTAPQYRWSMPSHPVGSPVGTNRGVHYPPAHGGHPGYRPVYPGYRYRQPYLPYVYANSTYLVPGLLNSYWDYQDGFNVNDESASIAQPQGEDNGAYSQEPIPEEIPQGQGSYQPQPYQGQGEPPPPPSPAEPLPQAAITLVFKDGHSQQVRNYAMTQRTLYVLDDASSGRRPEIPLDAIDIAATQRTNREAGLDFNPPITAN